MQPTNVLCVSNLQCKLISVSQLLKDTNYMSCVGTLQQNGRVEWKHRLILNVVCALRFQVSIPIQFWGEGILLHVT
uniref:Polynucleotidyl transferase, Ribonuclease H fold n=1 Tax=Medicago truncatula TaxID=3880 RepID=A2Q1V8_MEDTR|nr:Polynucleotidyl transferase, Ribonuclease H fold [Medicago truncatula]